MILYILAVLLFLIGLYGIIVKRNLIIARTQRVRTDFIYVKNFIFTIVLHIYEHLLFKFFE